MGLMVLLVYVWSVLGLQVLNENGTKESEEYFASLWLTMLTLLRIATLDGGWDVYGPFVAERPALSLYFFPLLLMLSIGLMNLVLAIIVEGAFDQANADRELQ